MPSLRRFGVSLEKSLSNKFDRYLKNKKYKNRSEAIRDLIREALVKEEWQGDGDIAGVIMLVYDHHIINISNLYGGVSPIFSV